MHSKDGTDPSGFVCYMFGGNESYSVITWEPDNAHLPNPIVRFMMRVMLGCTWKRIK